MRLHRARTLKLLLLAFVVVAPAWAIEPEVDHPPPVEPLQAGPVLAEDTEPQSKTSGKKGKGKKGLSLEPERFIDLDVEEGTWISVDVSPDGQTVVFDFLGDLYTVPLSGGDATQLTSGLGFDSQPRYSPDGKRIVFTSDRSGGENIWILNLADGDSTQLTKGKKLRYQSPEWTPDGNYIVGSKSGLRYGRPKLWLWHVDGGSGVKLIKEPEQLKTTGAAFGADGRFIWFAQRMRGWNYNAQFPQYQLAVYDREHGTVSSRSSRYGSGFRPTLSPDGTWLVYGTRHDEDTALVLRNLATGEELWLAYPVQHDAQEGRATRDVLPGMSFTPDSKELVASYGGKIWRIPIDGSDPIPVPFRVRTRLPVGPLVEFDYPIADDATFVARQIRHASTSPDGRHVVFSALDRLWGLELPDGEAFRLTREDGEGEQQPLWSPDGKSVAYVTWTVDGGHIKKVRFGRQGRPETLTKTPGVYRQLAWSKDGKRIVALRTPARAMQQAVGPLFSSAETDIIWVPAKGGAFTTIAPSNGRVAPHFGPEADRIYLFHSDHGLVSIQWDGTDERRHLEVVGGKLPDQREPFSASMILMSPAGGRALASVVHQLYTVTVPYVGGDTPKVNVSNPKNASFPVHKLTDIGGQFPVWSADGGRVHWSMGNAYVTYDLAAAEAAEDSADAAKRAKAKSEADDEADAGSEDEEGDAPQSEAAETKPEVADDSDKDDADEEDKPPYTPQEIRVRIDVERDIPQGVVVLRGARIITMNGDEVIRDGDLVIENNRIAAVGRRGSVDVPQGARVIDVAGSTIVPGFVDTHAHLRPAWGIHKAQPWQYLANLAFGVTTTRDPQTATTDVLTYGDLVEAGRILGPRIYSTGPGVFWNEALTDQKEARNVLRRYSDYYDTKTIKMYVAGNREQRQWIIKAARELQLMPTTEGSLNMKLNLTQIQDGYPGHEHNFPIYPVYEDVTRLCVESRVCYTPTLLVAYGGPFGENYWFTRTEVHDHAKLRRYVPHERIDARTLRTPWFRDDQHVFPEQAVFVKRLVEAGGRAGVGSHGQLQGLGYHWELWSMASGGISQHDALRVATILGAEGLGLDTDLGSIEPGKLADLVVLERNPLENIRDTESLAYVMKNGRLYEAETLREVWPRERELERQYWWADEPHTAAGLER